MRRCTSPEMPDLLSIALGIASFVALYLLLEGLDRV
jgi:hypothetical protein